MRRQCRLRSLWRAGDLDHLHDAFQAAEVVWVGRVERETCGCGSGRDHQICQAAPGCPARILNRCTDPAEDAGSVRVERDGIELALCSRQDVGAAGPLVPGGGIVTTYQLNSG